MIRWQGQTRAHYQESSGPNYDYSDEHIEVVKQYLKIQKRLI